MTSAFRRHEVPGTNSAHSSIGAVLRAFTLVCALLPMVSRTSLAQLQTYCIDGAKYSCFGIEVLTAQTGAGTDVTVRVRNLQGATVPNVSAHVAWSRIFAIELVAAKATFGGGPITTADPVVIAEDGLVGFGDLREAWFSFNVGDDNGAEIGYALETPYTQGGAELIGCGVPPDQAYPYLKTCDPSGAAMVEFRFSTEGQWNAAEPGIIVVLNDSYGQDASCLIPGTHFDDPAAYHCVDPSAPANSTPIASAGGPYTGTEGAPVQFNGTGSSDPDGTALTYDWDFGDGATSSEAQPSHTYADNGDYAVSLTVSDGALSATADIVVTITNVAPVVTAGADVTVTLGDPVTLSASFADPGVNDAEWSLSVDWGIPNGVATTTPPSPGVPFDMGPLTYSAPGVYTVIVSIMDKDGQTGSDEVIVTVVNTNTAPVASAGGPYNGDEGSSIAFNGTASTDSDGDALTYDWDFGDGSAHGVGPNPTHAYADNGSYTVVLTVSDAVLSHVATAIVTVANVAPTGTLALPSSLTEGSPYTISVADAGDPSSADLSAGLQYSFDCGNGLGFRPYGSALSQTCAGLDDGDRTVRLRIRDKDGAVTTLTRVATIVNVAPVVDIVAVTSLSIKRNKDFSLHLTFTDPWVLDLPWRITIDWGNGTQSFSSLTALTNSLQTRRFKDAGRYVIRVTVVDNDGGVGTSTNIVLTVAK